MNYRDFKKFNGQDFAEILKIDEAKTSYNHEVGLLGGVEIQIQYEDDSNEADVRLMDGTLIGHLTIGREVETNKYVWCFEASDKEWY